MAKMHALNWVRKNNLKAYKLIRDEIKYLSTAKDRPGSIQGRPNKNPGAFFKILKSKL